MNDEEQKKPFLTETTTERGFAAITFKDSYGHDCSLQESSSMAKEGHIWFGLEDADPKIMAANAPRYGINPGDGTGWVPYPVPSEVLMHTRMHLSQQQVYEMLPVLTRFAATGYLPKLKELKAPAPEGDHPTIKYSVDGGCNYAPAPEGVRVVYEGVPMVVDGEEQQGMISMNHTHEGLVTDVYGTRVEQYDTLIATAAVDFDQIVVDAILIDTAEDEENEFD